MDFRASGVRSLKLNIFLILKEVKTNLILRSASQKRLTYWADCVKNSVDYLFRRRRRRRIFLHRSHKW